MRTYAGHSTAEASNALYRTNLAKGQTGLSVAFDLPTQTGYDPDSPLSRGEVGKVGVPVPHLGEMRKLFARHPAHRDEHLDDHQRDRDVAARDVPGRRGGAEPRPLARRGRRTSSPAPPRTTSSRSTSPAGPTSSAPEASLRLIARHDRLHGPRDPEVEPDQHLQLPPAGGRRDARAGARVRAVHRDRRARPGEGLRPGLRRRLREGRRPDLVLRQRRRPVRRGDLQDAGLRAAVGRDHPRALRRDRTRRCAASATACRSTRSA